MSNTPRTDNSVVETDWLGTRVELVNADFARKLERENAVLRELLNEPYQFFSFGHRALEPWGQALTQWCERAEQLGLKKETRP